MIILFFLLLQIIPDNEYVTYETYEKGKLGKIVITSHRDSIGYHIFYKSDRSIEVILDSLTLGTIYINKFVNNRRELTITRNKEFKVYFKGEKHTYRETRPVYDRHTLDFALRGFSYSSGFKTSIRLHIPEFMIVNAELEVIGEEIMTCPVGKIPCWKVQLVPRVLFFSRKLYFWIEKAWPHRFVKYADSSGQNYILLTSSKEYETEEVDPANAR